MLEKFGEIPFREMRLFRGRLPRWMASLTLALALQCLHVQRARGEDHADYKYGYYGEEHGRIEVQTHSALGEVALKPWLSLKGQMVYDAISGATPTGGLPVRGRVPTVEIEDERWAGTAEAALKWERFTFRPQISYSDESDYRSLGAALTTSIDFNQRNTTLNFGIAQSWDEIIPNAGTFLQTREDKDSTDFLLGLNQLLGPRTVLTANFTLGFSSGYLSDPYKGVEFRGYPAPGALFAEKRPDDKTREIGYLALSHFFEPLRGSAELSYRLYHDSFGIWSHTAGAQWNQKLGRHVILSPLFRFSHQTAADFYSTSFPGDPSVSAAGVPRHYSADYRLSEFNAFTLGLTVTWKINDHVSIDGSYYRYEMDGTDGKTAASAYPSANIVVLGARVSF